MSRDRCVGLKDNRDCKRKKGKKDPKLDRLERWP